MMRKKRFSELCYSRKMYEAVLGTKSAFALHLLCTVVGCTGTHEANVEQIVRPQKVRTVRCDLRAVTGVASSLPSGPLNVLLVQ